MKVTSIHGLYNYLLDNSNFSRGTINSVIIALGYNLDHYSKKEFRELSGNLKDCARHGADSGFAGFVYYRETIAFFKENRQDIVRHMEQTAAEMGTDIISMVQGFGVFCVFRHSDKPTSSEVGKALWDSEIYHSELDTLYNVFAWYTLEEIAQTWYRYLEDNPAHAVELSA